jgi:hypothetical protein
MLKNLTHNGLILCFLGKTLEDKMPSHEVEYANMTPVDDLRQKRIKTKKLRKRMLTKLCLFFISSAVLIALCFVYWADVNTVLNNTHLNDSRFLNETNRQHSFNETSLALGDETNSSFTREVWEKVLDNQQYLLSLLSSPILTNSSDSLNETSRVWEESDEIILTNSSFNDEHILDETNRVSELLDQAENILKGIHEIVSEEHDDFMVEILEDIEHDGEKNLMKLRLVECRIHSKNKTIFDKVLNSNDYDEMSNLLDMCKCNLNVRC